MRVAAAEEREAGERRGEGVGCLKQLRVGSGEGERIGGDWLDAIATG